MVLENMKFDFMQKHIFEHCNFALNFPPFPPEMLSKIQSILHCYSISQMRLENMQSEFLKQNN